MHRLFALFFLAAGLMLPAAAWASGDYTCGTHWQLEIKGAAECTNVPFLAPSNDSRVNLHLMLLDAGVTKLHTGVRAAQPDYGGLYPPLQGPSPFALGDIETLVDPMATPRSDYEHAIGEGSRCDSNNDGAARFAAALAQSTVPTNERAILIAARKALKPQCAADPAHSPAPLPPVAVQSPAGKQYAVYLQGADAFYAGRFNDAERVFRALQSSPNPWLKETAAYMLGRAALNRSQINAFGEFGEFTKALVDAGALKAARTAFDAYLRQYPRGAYAPSTRGLLRRTDWLGGKTTDLAHDFEQALLSSNAAVWSLAPVSLVNETDAKLLAVEGTTAPAIHDPMLLAVFDLMNMRVSEKERLLGTAALDQQKAAFAGKERLFAYLRAAHAIYVENDPAKALGLLPTALPKGPMTYLEFSEQTLRAMALDDKGDRAGARKLWLALMPLAQPPLQHAALELGLALNQERAGAVDQLFADGSSVTDPDIRERLLQYAAGPDLLRRQARAASAPERERRIALYTLLYKEMTRARYKDFVADLALIPPGAKSDNPGQHQPDPDFDTFRWAGASTEGYACPAIKELGQALMRAPDAPENRVCLAEFVRVSNLDYEPLDISPDKDELGGAPSRFAGERFSRLEIYKAVIADTKTTAQVKAYALYRAVQCYAPSGNNQCGGKDVPVSQRKAWFQALKTSYPNSAWAQKLKYYW